MNTVVSISLAVVVLTIGYPAVQATVTSTSTFERCTNDEDDCEEKLTMQINLQSGANAGEEILISQVDCADGLCEGAAESALNTTIKLTFYHTRPELKYDLMYFADFNAKPHEVVVYGTSEEGCACTGPGGDGAALELLPGEGGDAEQPEGCSDENACFGSYFGPTCGDGGRDPAASCGWLYPQSYVAKMIRDDEIATIADLLQAEWQSAPIDKQYDRVANVVPDSQGFCCDCDIDDFLFENYDYSRGNLACEALGDGPHASAHCLRMSNLWYSAYEIGASRENYNIYINLQTCDSEGNNCFRPDGMSIASVGPERPKTVLETEDAENEIRIEWAPYGKTDNAIDLTSKMLLRPNCHGDPTCYDEYATFITRDGEFEASDPDPAVAINDPNRWLLIDKSAISMTGNDCNQIGLTYSGFRNQGENKCIRAFESCLDDVRVNGKLMSSSKIEDYVDADLDDIANGKVGRFFPQFLYPASQISMERGTNDYASLGYYVDEYRVSQITLILSGTLLAVREFTGELEVVDFGLSCLTDDARPQKCFSSSFESLSNDGLISVTLRNIGSFPDMYQVSFPYDHYEIDNGDGTFTLMSEADRGDLNFIASKSTDTLPGRSGLTAKCSPGTIFEASTSAKATQCWDQCVNTKDAGVVDDSEPASGETADGASTEDVAADGEVVDGRRHLQGEATDPDKATPETTDGEATDETSGVSILGQLGGITDQITGKLQEASGRETIDEDDGVTTSANCDTTCMACITTDPECCVPKLQCGGGSIPSDPIQFEDLRDDCDTVSFQINSNAGIQASYCVRMEVRNQIGKLVFPQTPEQARICFNTTEVVYAKVGDAEDAFAAGGEPLLVDPNDFSCEALCKETDVVCLVSEPACQDAIFIVIAAFLAVICILTVLWKTGICKYICCCCGKEEARNKERP
jgi:hypothetical protein